VAAFAVLAAFELAIARGGHPGMTMA
jgi:hypothetical protein